MLKMKSVAAVAALMAAPALSMAAAPTLSEVLAASGVSVSGAMDVSYDYVENDAAAFRAFDTGVQTFSLHQINLTVAKLPASGWGASANLIFGDDAKVTGGNGDDFDLFQGFVQYVNGGYTFQGGRLATLAGSEVVLPSANMNATRSLLFFFQPLVHTGVRNTLKLSDTLAATLGYNNGAIGAKTNNNTDQTIEAQLAFTPSSSFSAYLTAYSGNEDPNVVGSGVLRSDTLDLVVNLGLTDALTLAVNGDYFSTENGTGGHTITKGVAVYAGFKPSATFRLGLRGEYIDIDTGTPSDAYLREVTLTAGHALSDSLEVIAELRNDSADSQVFATRNAGKFPASNDQTTGTLKAIFKF